MLNRDGLSTRTSSAYRRAFIRILSYATVSDGAIPCSVIAEAMQVERIAADVAVEVVEDMYSGGVRLVREDIEILSTPGEPVYLTSDEAKARVKSEIERLVAARRGD